MANNDRTRKLLVRSAMVSSVTIATLVGAQNLALLDASRFASMTASSFDATVAPVDAAIVVPLVATVTPLTLPKPASDVVIQLAAPSMIILRQSGTVAVSATDGQTQNPTTVNTRVIQPPVAAQIAAPDPVFVQQQAVSAPQPVVVQQPQVQQSRSTR